MNGLDDQLIIFWNVKSGQIEKMLDMLRLIGFFDFCFDEQFVIVLCQGFVQFWNFNKVEMVWEIFSIEIFVLIVVVGICDILVVILDNVIKFVDLSDGIFIRDFVDRKFFYDKIVGQGDSVVFVSVIVSYIRIYDLKIKDICLFI